jgi:hypothetical protein
VIKKGEKNEVLKTWHLLQCIQVEGYTRQIVPLGFAATLPLLHSGGKWFLSSTNSVS